MNLSTVSEPSDIKQNLVDQTCELLKWLCNDRTRPHNTTRQQLWQYPLAPDQIIAHLWPYTVWVKKNPPLGFSENFSQTVGNF